MTQLQQPRQVADYDFLNLLGEGSQGSVYLASRPDRLPGGTDTVAVKLLARPATEEEFATALGELTTYASIGSPYLTQLIEAGRQQDGTVYYAMEYAPGGSLALPPRSSGPSAIVRALTSAAWGAHALHEGGLAHRAIKPSNVLLFESGARLADPDLQHLLAPGQTISGRGSAELVQYLAPEVIRGEPVSRATDLWALGVTLHVALTGEGIYVFEPEAGPMSALRAVMAGARPELSPALPEGLSRVIEACLELDPEARPDSAEALADRLDALAEQL
ncbi:MAG: hypothetical protein NVSMB29_07770 [Candidatus Dormibacteria bacterium]